MVDGGEIRIGVFATVPSLLGRQGHGPFSHFVCATRLGLFFGNSDSLFSFERQVTCRFLFDFSIIYSYLDERFSRSFFLVAFVSYSCGIRFFRISFIRNFASSTFRIPFLVAIVSYPNFVGFRTS